MCLSPCTFVHEHSPRHPAGNSIKASGMACPAATALLLSLLLQLHFLHQHLNSLLVCCLASADTTQRTAAATACQPCRHNLPHIQHRFLVQTTALAVPARTCSLTWPLLLRMPCTPAACWLLLCLPSQWSCHHQQRGQHRCWDQTHQAQLPSHHQQNQSAHRTAQHSKVEDKPMEPPCHNRPGVLLTGLTDIDVAGHGSCRGCTAPGCCNYFVLLQHVPNPTTHDWR